MVIADFAAADLLTMGFSETARFSQDQADAPTQDLSRVFSREGEIGDAIEDLAKESFACARPNWDGFGGTPISYAAYFYARRFLESLPPGTPRPQITAEPDGHLALEWYRSTHRLISVSVAPDGDLHYAAVLGPNQAYGTEAFLGQAPDRITTLIDRVISA